LHYVWYIFINILIGKIVKRIILAVLFMILISFDIVLSGDYANSLPSGGSGSSDDPFKISDAADLEQLMKATGNWDKYFILTHDIDCSGHSWASGFPKPIGLFSQQFTGRLDGQRNSISNISFTPTSEYFGFFGFIGAGGNVTNLRLYNIDFQYYNQQGFGVFCGVNAGNISYCSCSGEVHGDWHIGGFCGLNSGIISLCYSNCLVSGNDRTGGFCGTNDQGTISNCYCLGQVSSTGSNTGGFVGYNYNGASISYCYSLCSTTGNSVFGGFCGFVENATFECCYWGFEGADPGLMDTGSNGDIPNIKELNPSDFAYQSSFSCFDFDHTWMMAGGRPVLTELTIPTLTEWAVIIFIGLLAGVGGWFVWRRVM
jgi:hypothetical protein